MGQEVKLAPPAYNEETGPEREVLGPKSPPVKGRAETQCQASFPGGRSVLPSSFWRSPLPPPNPPLPVPQLPAHMVETWTGSENRAFVFLVQIPNETAVPVDVGQPQA